MGSLFYLTNCLTFTLWSLLTIFFWIECSGREAAEFEIAVGLFNLSFFFFYLPIEWSGLAFFFNLFFIYIGYHLALFTANNPYVCMSQKHFTLTLVSYFLDFIISSI